MTGFISLYPEAFVFLCIIIVLVGVLWSVYFCLSREMCNCFGDKKTNNDDEEEDLVSESDDTPNNLKKNGSLLLDSENFPLPPDEQLPQHRDVATQLPEVCVTEAAFRKPNRSRGIKSILKKKKKTYNSLDAASEATSLISLPPATTPLVQNQRVYGSAATLPSSPPPQSLKRSNSLESFISTMTSASAVTTVVEEFGDEVSPGRIQVAVEYDASNWRLTLVAQQADCLFTSSPDAKIYWQVHMTLLPFKKHRFKSKYKPSSTPIWGERHTIESISRQALAQLAVRFRVYGRTGRTTGRKRLAGETSLELSSLAKDDGKPGTAIVREWRELKRLNIEQRKSRQASPQVSR